MHFGRIAYSGKKSVLETSSNLGQFLGHITTLAEVTILSMNRNLGDIWFSGKISKIISILKWGPLNWIFIDV